MHAWLLQEASRSVHARMVALFKILLGVHGERTSLSSLSPPPSPIYLLSISSLSPLSSLSLSLSLSNPPCLALLLFFSQMAALFEVVVFTASLDKYANPVLDRLDGARTVRAARAAFVKHCWMRNIECARAPAL